MFDGRNSFWLKFAFFIPRVELGKCEFEIVGIDKDSGQNICACKNKKCDYQSIVTPHPPEMVQADCTGTPEYFELTKDIRGKDGKIDHLKIAKKSQRENKERFKGRVYSPDNIATEHRGKDQLDDTCYRLVRLAFDDTISPKEAKLVIGEVLNFPGKWSSYPPHHHSQPELYYYELSPAWGYGHGELGDDVYKIKNGDVLAITDNKTHSQTSAPGFHMYYLWAIRHDDKKRYNGFTYIKSFENMLE